jgi:hypothetical protein
VSTNVKFRFAFVIKKGFVVMGEIKVLAKVRSVTPLSS